MPRVDFYRLIRDPVERMLPAIATRILGNGDRLLVVAASAMQRQAIDEALDAPAREFSAAWQCGLAR